MYEGGGGQKSFTLGQGGGGHKSFTSIWGGGGKQVVGHRTWI